MTIAILIKVYSENNKGLVFEKRFETDHIPNIGDRIIDPIFAENKKIVEVLHNFKCGKVYAILEKKEVKDEALEGHIQEVAKMHNWEISKSVING